MDREKIKKFEYFLFKLYHSYPNPQENDISIIKSLKLFFFLCTIDCDLDSNILNEYKFYAMPYGHVEGDIYDAIKNDSLEFFRVNRESAEIKQPLDEIIFEDNTKDLVDDKYQKLIEKNANIYSLPAFQLVELSHLWLSWKHFYSKGVKEGNYKTEIPISFIIREPKIYSFE